MLLLLHITSALVSILFSFHSFLKPGRASIIRAGVSSALMVTTGVALTIQHPAHLVQSCIVGLILVGTNGALILYARKNLISAA